MALTKPDNPNDAINAAEKINRRTEKMDSEMNHRIDKSERRWKLIEEFLITHEYIMNSNVREICGVSAATANRILSGFEEDRKLMKCRIGRCYGYRLLH